MSMADWSLFVGVLLITMVLVGNLLARLPLSTAMIYLCLPYGLGPGGMRVIMPDPLNHVGTLEFATEAALLISLFASGLKQVGGASAHRYHNAVGLDPFLCLGLIAIACGAAQLCLASSIPVSRRPWTAGRSDMGHGCTRRVCDSEQTPGHI